MQDLGRPRYAHLGISASGAADAVSLRAGNLLCGNPEGAAALEMTLAGGVFEFESAAVVALTGSDFGSNIARWTAVEVKGGTRVECGHTKSGARAYLCVRGGIHVPPVLGSASTHLLTGIGGFEGRALKRGDRLAVGEATAGPPLRSAIEPPKPHPRIRVTSQRAVPEFFESSWQVKESSDRMGLRLQGPALSGHTGHMLTEGVPLGAVQVPPGGQPIILFVEHQTTGGYPKIANVISADFHALGQLRPRDHVRFEPVTIETALRLLRAQEDWLRALA
ncbi:MAG: biotin-dependent carboxyltransferase family protein [Bryobacteraceae bacterium]